MYTSKNPPPQSKYIEAVRALQGDLTDIRLKVLIFQFQQPGRAVTSQAIRDLLGYPSISTSNNIYGGLGRKFAEALGMETEEPGAPRTNFWKALSVGDGSGEHFTWIMRPELAFALVEAGVVDASEDGVAPVQDPDIHSNSLSAKEGRKRLVRHLQRERNAALIAAKKASMKSHTCEVCGFDSQSTYGEDYCEVHHLTPLSELDEERETTLDDLAIVCANCHRIIHLQTPPVTIDELRARLVRNNS